MMTDQGISDVVTKDFRATNLASLAPNSVPTKPVFSTVEGERRWRKHVLVVALRTFGDKGYDAGLAGHFTVKDPERPDCFWVNPMDQHLSMMTEDDLVLIGPKGEILAGDRPANTGAFSVHAAIHEARPDIICSIHTHLTYSKILAMRGDVIQPTTQDACLFYEDMAVYSNYDGVPGERRIGEEIMEVMGQRNAVIMKHHGALTVGDSIEAAAFRFLELEKCAQDQVLAQQAYGHGLPVLDAQTAKKVHDYLSGSKAMWLSFQSEYLYTCARHGLKFSEEALLKQHVSLGCTK